MKTAILAMLLATATVVLMDVAMPTPAAAGWCYETCGVKRPPPPRVCTTTCSGTSRRGYSDSQCTTTCSR